MLRNRIRPAMLHSIERLLQGQIEIAQAAGVDICEEEETTAEDQSSEEISVLPSSNTDWEIASNWTCGSNIGAWGAWMKGGDPEAIIEKSELIFNLQTNPPDVSYDFTFHGLANLPQTSYNGETYWRLPAEAIHTGNGTAKWDGDYFYGSVIIDREEYLSYPSETSEFIDSFERAVIGALSPDQNEIQICFHTFTREQFDYIKNEPFGNLLEHCSSHQYFVCTPQE